MPNTLNLYLDDSGTRHPTQEVGKKAAHNYDWFALGGIIVRECDEEAARGLHSDFLGRWPQITNPLHSSEIRSQNEGFFWLRDLEAEERNRFYEEPYQLMRAAPVTGIACVIDRPGYNARYLALYEQQPWLLCKTAFSVVVERSAKRARDLGAKLRVRPERCNKPEDANLKAYYDALKTEGMPFGKDASGPYAPLSGADFRDLLYEFDLKRKTSPLSQLADLFLWPICMGGYHKSNRPYRRLMEDGKLIECHLGSADWPTLATKYSCFEGVEVKP
ncbi:DUF3800 domain-containing protein [Tianweitania sp. BSSL-BM11]|uniref:DUF3800 domain-containing protein n=1 Tax=Tianweitania aestuarii TaxID=2814886 RepID=A0ABS5RQ80_9HYPH|nr:DUF3800 domain-containing protein [Tianweitania aestuarii]MBS9719196.1 DUF3800 domain-containing protein [Tianweitania aestuarii]